MNRDSPDLQCYEDFTPFYYRISAISEDLQFSCSGVRGDGYCSIWSVLIGWSLLEDRKNLILNQLGEIFTQPTSMNELVQILISASNTLLTDESGLLDTYNTMFNCDIEKWELEALVAQLSQSSDTIQTIQGIGQFKLLSIMVGIEIQVLDEETGTVDKFGDSAFDTIRIGTNGCHYSIYNNKKSKDLTHLTNRYWWNLQWENHPHVSDVSGLMTPVVN